MFSLAVGFATRKRRWPSIIKGVVTSSFGEKRPRRSPSHEEAQKDGATVLVESPYLASNDQLALRFASTRLICPWRGRFQL